MANSQRTTLPALDGLRGLAVSLTVIYHYLTHLLRNESVTQPTRQWLADTLPYWDFGASGVHLFFVLSGFLLFMPYARAILAKRELPSTKGFYLRRVRRIVPAYWVSLMLFTLFQPVLWGSGLALNLGLHAIFLHNLNQDFYTSITVPYWTLAVESQYYLLLPLWAWLLARFVGGFGESKFFARVTTFFAFSFLTSPIWLAVLIYGLKPIIPAIGFYASLFETLTYFNIFVVGMACGGLYVYVTEFEPSRLNTSRIGRYAGVLGVVSLIIHRLCVVLEFTGNPLYWLFNYSLLGLGYGGILLCTLFGWESWTRFFSSRLMCFIGLISYSLYLWNWFMYEQVITPLAVRGAAYVPASLFDATAFLLSAVLTIALLIPVAYLSYRLFEKPFFNTSPRRTS